MHDDPLPNVFIDCAQYFFKFRVFTNVPFTNQQHYMQFRFYASKNFFSSIKIGIMYSLLNEKNSS